MVLLTPGPTPVPKRVLEAMAQPMIPHRSADFEQIHHQCAEAIRRIFQTRGPVLTVAGSGTTAMEAALLSLAPPGSTTVACASGKFGERWQDALDRAAGPADLRTLRVTADWGEPIRPDQLADVLCGQPDVGLVCFVHCETSTATLSDAAELAKVVRETAPDAMVVVDAITSLAAVPVEPAEWGLDAVVGASQKGFGLPPGLGFVGLSERAADRLRAARKSIPLSLDLAETLRAHDRDATPFTPPISLFYGLREALVMLEEEGLDARLSRTARFADTTRRAFADFGLTLGSRQPSDSVTALIDPPGGADAMRSACRRRRGVALAGGQGPWKGRAVRMSHMGFLTPSQTLAGLAAIGEAVCEADPARQRGVREGLNAAEAALASTADAVGA